MKKYELHVILNPNSGWGWFAEFANYSDLVEAYSKELLKGNIKDSYINFNNNIIKVYVIRKK